MKIGYCHKVRSPLNPVNSTSCGLPISVHSLFPFELSLGKDGLAAISQPFPPELSLLNGPKINSSRPPEMVGKSSHKSVFRDFVSQSKESRGKISDNYQSFSFTFSLERYSKKSEESFQ